MPSTAVQHAARHGLITSLCLFASIGSAWAGVLTFSGNLGDSANAALVAPDLSAPSFADDYAIANNVALYTLHVPVAGSVSFTSTGFAAGGVDPYFSLFSGKLAATASFLDSNYNSAFLGSGGDFINTDVLAAGDYTIAIGAFANMSIAENYGVGFLSDGFSGLGEPYALGTGAYALNVSLPDAGGPTVPEPGSSALALTALLAALWSAKRRRS